MRAAPGFARGSTGIRGAIPGRLQASSAETREGRARGPVSRVLSPVGICSLKPSLPGIGSRTSDADAMGLHDDQEPA